jgi:hypothetical protein
MEIVKPEALRCTSFFYIGRAIMMGRQRLEYWYSFSLRFGFRLIIWRSTIRSSLNPIRNRGVDYVILQGQGRLSG